MAVLCMVNEENCELCRLLGIDLGVGQIVLGVCCARWLWNVALVGAIAQEGSLHGGLPAMCPMELSRCICLSVCGCPYVCGRLSVCASVCGCMSVCLSVCQSICLYACQAVNLSICLSVRYCHCYNCRLLNHHHYCCHWCYYCCFFVARMCVNAVNAAISLLSPMLVVTLV